jgi:hypothetical protein
LSDGGNNIEDQSLILEATSLFARPTLRVEAMKAALEQAGVEFTNGKRLAVRLRK